MDYSTSECVRDQRIGNGEIHSQIEMDVLHNHVPRIHVGLRDGGAPHGERGSLEGERSRSQSQQDRAFKKLPLLRLLAIWGGEKWSLCSFNLCQSNCDQPRGSLIPHGWSGFHGFLMHVDLRIVLKSQS